MSIEKQEDNLYDVECDECGEIETFEAAEWSELMEKLSAAGWIKTKVSGEWEHYCSDCSGEDDDDLDDDDEDDEDDEDED